MIKKFNEYIKENVDDDLKHVEQQPTEQPEIYEPMNREPLETDKLKIFKKDKDGKKIKKEDQQKYLVKYYKDLKRVLIKLNKDLIKDKSYLSKHLYKIVNDYKKPFSDVQKDLQWLVYKLRKDPDFIENQEEKIKKNKKK